ncbi:class I glutamine amidotransferase-like superfamily protein [Actinidia rufa]|uniref:Class I glutamine amidotransferase-like superfamily protein n=1 Tax=Actinidia rufa TaxID=165716 RepID=A0A7J0GFJ4_9ERIC|nr:class I glutamine amidotransferase-like superfamily protein [Actinidia rufa]
MANSRAQRTVLMLCGDYMEDYEAMVPFQALLAYGVSVDPVYPGKKAGDICRTAIQQASPHQTYSEWRGHNFTLNATFDAIEVSKYDGLVIPGGPNCPYLPRPLILAAAGSVKGRKCTGYPSVKSVLVAAGAHWVEPETLASCTLDGNLVTGATYEGHPEYIQFFVKALGGTIKGSDKRILFLCGDYMEDYEVMVPFQSLQALGCHVDAICPKKAAGDKCITAVHDFEDASSYDALVIPGGRAPEYLALDESVIKLVKEFMEARKPVASICHGQQILSAAGVLKGRKCTAYPAVKLNVVLAGATWLEPDPIDRCFTDGNLVTGAAWPGHPEFISQLMALLGIQVLF